MTRPRRCWPAVVDVLRHAHLLELSARHHHDPVAERHGLNLVVRDVDRGDAEAPVELLQLCADLDAELRVEVRKRLVEQERPRLADERPPHGHPLALSARELGGLASEQLLDAEHRGDLLHPAIDLFLRFVPLLQPEREVLVDRHVRVERVVLEHHRDVAVFRREAGHDPLTDRDRARRRLIETGDHPQSRRLPASGGSDQDQELAVLGGDRQVVDGHRPARELLRHVRIATSAILLPLQPRRGHGGRSTAARGRTR